MQTFKKEERLCNKSTINILFFKGKSFFIHPLKVIWMPTDKDIKFPAQVLISVSKRNFKKAVDRNHIKRLMREAYRKNKYLLYNALDNNHKKLTFTIIYATKDIITYEELERKIIQVLNQLISEHEKNTK
jgi:ribonuclease P protein component